MAKAMRIRYHSPGDTLEIFYELNQPTVADEVDRNVFVHRHAKDPQRVVGITIIGFLTSMTKARKGSGGELDIPLSPKQVTNIEMVTLDA